MHVPLLPRICLPLTPTLNLPDCARTGDFARSQRGVLPLLSHQVEGDACRWWMESAVTWGGGPSYPRAIRETTPVANNTPIICMGNNRSPSTTRARPTVTNGYIDVTTVTTGSRTRWTASRKNTLPPISKHPAAAALTQGRGPMVSI